MIVKFIKLLLLVPFCISFSGCATRVLQIQETYHEVRVTLDSSNKELYYLYNQQGKIVSYAKSKSGKIIFELPEIQTQKTCLYIADKKKKKLEVKNSSAGSFEVKLAPFHYELKKTLKKAKNNINKANKKLEDIKNSLKYTQRKLSRNRAKKGNSCILPATRSIPSRPDIPCGSRDECYKDATQICFAIAFGSEGCSMALSEEGVPGVIANPSCGAIAAKLAEEKYSFDDVIIDAVRGSVDDLADSMMKEEEDWFTKMFGVVLKAANYASKYESAVACRNRFMNRNYGPYERWVKRVSKIKKEPHLTLKACKSLFSKRNKLLRKKLSAENEVHLSIKQASLARDKLVKIEQLTQHVSISCKK